MMTSRENDLFAVAFFSNTSVYVSRAFRRLHIFPRFWSVTCFRALSVGDMVTCFPALSVGYIRAKKGHKRARWKTRGRGTGSRGTGSRGTGSRGVENAGCGKHGVWKTRGVENAGCGKCGVWKTRGLVENAGKMFFRQNMNFAH